MKYIFLSFNLSNMINICSMYELCITLHMNVKIVKNKEYSHVLNEVWTKLQSIKSMKTNNMKIDIVNAQSSLLNNKCKGWSCAIQCIYRMITYMIGGEYTSINLWNHTKLSNQFFFKIQYWNVYRVIQLQSPIMIMRSCNITLVM